MMRLIHALAAIAFLGACGPSAAQAQMRPVIAVFAAAKVTETADFLVPFSILSQSGLADVTALADQAGPVSLMPGLTLAGLETIADFDARRPQGADYMIVPALHHQDDPLAVHWIKAQADKGATIIAICDGTWTLAATGLLDGRHATGHWYSMSGLMDRYPKVHWIRDRRFIRDGKVQTSTGVSASIPAALALVEEIGGRAEAEKIALRYGIDHWDDHHDTSPFHLTASHISTFVYNFAAFWDHRSMTLALDKGIDEAALALTIDAWSRTNLAKVKTLANEPDVVSASGLHFIPDRIGGPPARVIIPAINAPLDSALEQIKQVFGHSTQRLVALQLEYDARP
jgi:transcriptional regulator GlxA family with amidase domain